ncbi:MAG: hypothetical protein IKB16_12910 [Lentisphaeria bacterium]|nr:hypothetical protein [Lentisphaeria bacterium]
MKKTLLTLGFAFASAIVLHAAPVTHLDGDFTKIGKDGRPVQWRLNMGPKMAKLVKISVAKDEKGVNVVTVDTKATPKNSAPLMGSAIKCKAGDKIIVSADVKTAGSFSFGFYRYSAKALMKSIPAKSFRIMNRKTTVKAEFIMKDDAKLKLDRVTPVLNLPANKVSSISNVKYELITAEELAKSAAK